MRDGVIVGANERQEWLLPWWWRNFSKYNRLPVCFIDFGLSPAMRDWCQERGQLHKLALRDLFIQDRDEVSSDRVSTWEAKYPDTFWDSRKGWFKKPAACLASPFERTIWLDNDCEVAAPLHDLFQACEHPAKIALAKDQNVSTYNSGVIVFQKQHPLLVEWAEQALTQNGSFRGDQDLLTAIIQEQQWPICELPSIYNWSMGYGRNKDVVIYHWWGEAAKTLIGFEMTIEKNFPT
jgi:hypothetical protein